VVLHRRPRRLRESPVAGSVRVGHLGIHAREYLALVRKTIFVLWYYLERRYPTNLRRYVVFQDVANEKTRDEFFCVESSGGTHISSGFEKAMDLLQGVTEHDKFLSYSPTARLRPGTSISPNADMRKRSAALTWSAMGTLTRRRGIGGSRNSSKRLCGDSPAPRSPISRTGRRFARRWTSFWSSLRPNVLEERDGRVPRHHRPHRNPSPGAGLSFDPVYFRMTDSDEIAEVASMGLPNRFIHWYWGGAYKELVLQQNKELFSILRARAEHDPVARVPAPLQYLSAERVGDRARLRPRGLLPQQPLVCEVQ